MADTSADSEMLGRLRDTVESEGFEKLRRLNFSLEFSWLVYPTKGRDFADGPS